jgi:hypothetical protein
VKSARSMFTVGACAVALIAVAAQGADTSDAASTAAEKGTLVIVPLEAPPLTFGPGLDAEAVLAANTGAGLSWAASEAVAEAGRTLFVVSGIAILAGLPERSRRADKQAASAEELMNAAGRWVPTIALAEEARALLQQAGVSSVRVSEQVRQVPGIGNRERTFTMHNWYRPIADWYGLASTPFSYAEPEVRREELVLEVGLSNYELGPGRVLYLLVNTKLVDPGNGKVLKKARKMVYPETADLKALFAGDASGFKRAFVEAARPALRDNLKAIGLLAKQESSRD